MTSRVSNRKQTYPFIVKKNSKLKISDNYRLCIIENGIGNIPPSDLVRLKNSPSDPPQLVASLKHLLQSTTSESEIDKFLVQPFKEQKPDQSSIENHL